MSEPLLSQARAGDDRAFRELVNPYRRELQLHCYRILGSVSDAEDALQETLVSAWRGLGTFEGRSTWRTWLYQIATNRCLNLVRDRGRLKRAAPVPPFDPPEPSRRGDVAWLEPYPDDQLPDPGPGPEARHQQREGVELAFIAALQRMPPRQAAALVLGDVLGFPLAEVAAMLTVSPVAAKGLLARGRAALDRTRPGPGRPDIDRAVSRRFAEAFVADDIDAVVALLTDDGWLSMPPAPHEYHGPAAVAAFLRASARWRQPRRFILVPTTANTQPAFGCYLPDASGRAAEPAGLIVLTIDRAAGRISAITRFLDVGPLERFALPARLEPAPLG